MERNARTTKSVFGGSSSTSTGGASATSSSSFGRNSSYPDITSIFERAVRFDPPPAAKVAHPKPFPAIEANGRVCGGCVSKGSLCDVHQTEIFVPGGEGNHFPADSAQVLRHLKDMPSSEQTALLRAFERFAQSSELKKPALEWCIANLYALQGAGEMVRDVFANSVNDIFLSSSAEERVILSEKVLESIDVINWAETSVGVGVIESLLGYGADTCRQALARRILHDREVCLRLLSHPSGSNVVLKAIKSERDADACVRNLAMHISSSAAESKTMNAAAQPQFYRSLECLADASVKRKGTLRSMCSSLMSVCMHVPEVSTDAEVARIELGGKLLEQISAKSRGVLAAERDCEFLEWLLSRYADAVVAGSLHTCHIAAPTITTALRVNVKEGLKNNSRKAGVSDLVFNTPELVDRLRRSVQGAHLLRACVSEASESVELDSFEAAFADWEITRATSPLMGAMARANPTLFLNTAIEVLERSGMSKWNDATFSLAATLLSVATEDAARQRILDLMQGPRGTPVSRPVISATLKTLNNIHGSLQDDSRMIASRMTSSLMQRLKTLRRSSRTFDSASAGLCVLGDHSHELTLEQRNEFVAIVAENIRLWSREESAHELVLLGLRLDADGKCRDAVFQQIMTSFMRFTNDKFGSRVLCGAWDSFSDVQRDALELLIANSINELSGTDHGRSVLLHLLPGMHKRHQETAVASISSKPEEWFDDDARFAILLEVLQESASVPQNLHAIRKFFIRSGAANAAARVTNAM